MRKNAWVLVFGVAAIVGFSFQNCSKVNFTPANTSLNSADGSNGGNGSNGSNNGGNDGSVSGAVKSTRPVLAVRGMNCIACHGAIGANVVTDFGYDANDPSYGNFMAGNLFFPDTSVAKGSYNGSATRTAFNDVDDGNGIGGWQSLTVTNGSIHVPKITIPAAIAQPTFTLNSDTTFAQVLQWLNPPGSNNVSMVAGVTPPAGQPTVIEDTAISIQYPSASEILGLLPSSAASQSLAAVAISITGQPTSQMTGIAPDPNGGQFVRNTTSTITCYGDVVVKGPLFLNNLTVTTDQNGCRLYVSQTVFIQGPITYTNTTNGSNLQITSARGIIMGMSAYRMSGSSSNSPLRANGNNSQLSGNDLVGGPWARFSTDLDVQYNPSGNNVNGVDSTTFFDNLVTDANAIGSALLLDAADPAYVKLFPASQTATEPSNSANGQTSKNMNCCGGTRVSINYTGLLLNAPHIHSRYAGTFQGVIIADVAMLARNPSSTQLEQFIYDPVFDSIPATSILPALTTQVLSIQH